LDEFQIFDMRFVRPNSIMPVIVKDREGKADVANKSCLESDLAKEWGDMRTVRSRRYQSKNVRKSKAVFGIEKWAGFVVHLLIDPEECRTETVSFKSKKGWRRRAIVRYEDDGICENEEF
jgi:hypothetical protein